MQIIIKTTQVELTEALTQYVEERIGGLEKYIGRFEEEGSAVARVELARTTQHHRHGDVFSVEVNLQIAGEVIRASRDGEEMYATIDEVKDILKAEIQKFKDLHVEKPISDAQRGEV
ncbi:MAG: Ribosomal subunit interface protein [Candidatus Wolfebacteria bacterium GW2011_GWE1_48_7]|uniref:Ribosomal subunit interface protein n=2 Tax=Candidatus Wolfeibacteriota TaxID=1752735 RepID=A0A0G1U7H2_9BACT|nr:MAG: Ribosomal subunit interface protein [Candidatus Wolfebacteria bacterium GW2011_GWB1_47_1]KKU34747.1 MAG: Ribosomal subunit interface protein [Candidatus Wolfebacteria bacterium GW2011_GWC2_46_275]KKU42415.1 MAG: Ribosomal subunit interface protein [Candidatus Wolfebacteria bacterium GW2011_GWB2_46_69]KKU54199.1 MAG: Ribosomal subunit interface protein [Candidatus Wolfebacteria bacterium GW2011_GWC1_47_103]KKU58709.1 MAG: Ribosomal subunit interface protein [Candidatus Wolfebacteria bact